MSRRLFGAAVLAAAIVGIPLGDAFAQKEKKKGDKGGEVTAPIDAAKLGSGEFVGVLKSTPGTGRTFMLEVEQTKLVPNKAGKGGGNPKGGGGNNQANRVIQLQNQLQQAQTQYATARTAQQKQQAAGRIRQYTGQLQQAMAQLQGGAAGGKGAGGAPAGFHYEKSKVSVEFQVAEKAKIRTAILPEAFDDKGNIKKYTSKELADLKGKDKSLPGYESSLEKLEVGQTVKVTQSVAPKEAVKDAPAKDMDKDKDDDVKADKSKQVKLIVILSEAAAPPAGKGKKK